MINRHIVGMSLLVLTLQVAPVCAQTADDLAAAKDLMEVAQVTAQMKVMLPIINQQLKPAIVQNRPEVERDYDKIMPLLMEKMKQRISELTDALTAVYTRHFSAAEMREIAAFYRTSTGQKALAKMPVVLQESMAMGQKFGQSIVKEMQTEITDQLRKRGHKI